MENRLNLIITTATAAMLLMPMKTDAQKIASGLISPVSQPKVEQLVKTSPATKKKMEMETRQKYPKLYEGKLLQKRMTIADCKGSAAEKLCLLCL